jgi:hypothetical protein
VRGEGERGEGEREREEEEGEMEGGCGRCCLFSLCVFVFPIGFLCLKSNGVFLFSGLSRERRLCYNSSHCVCLGGSFFSHFFVLI